MGIPKNPAPPAWSIKPGDAKHRPAAKVEAPNTGTKEYINATIRRLSVFSDKNLKTDDEISSALSAYGSALADRQRDAIRVWLMRRAAERVEQERLDRCANCGRHVTACLRESARMVRGAKPLCDDCRALYDSPEFM